MAEYTLSNEIEASYEILRKYQKYEKLRRYTEKNERHKRDINMSNNKNVKVNQDKGLQGNEKIEQAIAGLQQETTQEMLAHTLTVIRRRMREEGQFILSVEPPTGDNQLRIGTVKTGDGKVWWAAFTSFEEELKGGGSVQSTFLTDIAQLFNSALQVNEIEGIILNPWNCTIMLDKNLINIILGNM